MLSGDALGLVLPDFLLLAQCGDGLDPPVAQPFEQFRRELGGSTLYALKAE